jgi:hypothetical protein
MANIFIIIKMFEVVVIEEIPILLQVFGGK